MKIHAEDTVTITLTITREDAQHLLADFDKSREPSTQGKRLYSTLSRIVHGVPTVDQIIREKYAKPTVAAAVGCDHCGHPEVAHDETGACFQVACACLRGEGARDDVG